MSFVATVYFRGPMSRWACKVHPRDVLWSKAFRWAPVAAGRAKTRARHLQHVGWQVQDEQGRVVAGEAPSRDIE
ncbi:MAG TPA: hypothetical protein VN660_13705 [Steroidobacteraceae bacterium]|nr:hypothetical protein [Steroidobacteraceae bacterium]